MAAGLMVVAAPTVGSAANSPSKHYVTTVDERAGTVSTTMEKISATQVRPDSSSGCVNSNDFNVVTCMSITGSGLHVDNMEGDTYVYNYTIISFIELTGPNGFKYTSRLRTAAGLEEYTDRHLRPQ